MNLRLCGRLPAQCHTFPGTRRPVRARISRFHYAKCGSWRTHADLEVSPTAAPMLVSAIKRILADPVKPARGEQILIIKSVELRHDRVTVQVAAQD